MAIVDKGVDELVGRLLDERVQQLDLAGPEGDVEHRPHLLVVGIVAAGQGRLGDPALFLVEIENFQRAAIWQRAAVARAFIAEILGIHQHLAQVLVTADVVETEDRILPDRGLLEQQFIGGIGTFLDLGVEEVDFRGRAWDDRIVHAIHFGHVVCLQPWYRFAQRAPVFRAGRAPLRRIDQNTYPLHISVIW